MERTSEKTTDEIVAESCGAVLVRRRTVAITTSRWLRRKVAKESVATRCICPFLCDAASEPCEFDTSPKALAFWNRGQS